MPGLATYPQYGIDFDDKAMDAVADAAVRLLTETGLQVTYDPFMHRIRGKAGYSVSGDRVRLEKSLVLRHIEEFRSARRAAYEKAAKATPAPQEWKASCGGFSLDVIDMDTDEIRPATCKDLAELTRLADSYGMGGPNIVQPQDAPPMMRDIAACKGSFENGQNFITNCHSHPRQTPYLVEMFKVVSKPFPVLIISVPPLRIAPESLEELLCVYDGFRADIEAGRIVIQPMIYNIPGVSGPVTAAGAMALSFIEHVGAHILLDFFDERIALSIGCGGAMPADLRNACYAFGSPRKHLFHYLSSRWPQRFSGITPPSYRPGGAGLTTNSCQMDEQAGLEKMAAALTLALQGARSFSNVGNLCVDDLFSGVQLVIDMETVAYIRELVESFQPSPEVASMDGIYQAILDVANGKDMFLSHETTVSMFRKIMPSSPLFHREKLRSWQYHRTTVKERAKEIAKERIKSHAFRRSDDQLRDLARIYAAAERELGHAET
jgi:trimethylamine:corrinoid methyltransferase-like protein